MVLVAQRPGSAHVCARVHVDTWACQWTRAITFGGVFPGMLWALSCVCTCQWS